MAIISESKLWKKKLGDWVIQTKAHEVRTPMTPQRKNIHQAFGAAGFARSQRVETPKPAMGVRMRRRGSGDDVLTGGRGNDRLEGGNGQDTYAIETGEGLSLIHI